MYKTKKGLPSGATNNSEWQTYFKVLKAVVKPSAEKYLPKAYSPRQTYYRNYNQVYDGETQWYRYVQFINQILRNIRRGEEDYCYYTYQILELLRFEPENLCADWLEDDECFKVYLLNNTVKQ